MFINNAYAQATTSGFSLDSLGGYWPILLMFVVLYFLMIRPQQKKQRQQRDMLGSLGVGDEVLTAGGIIGKILKVSDNYLVLEISAGAEIIIQKASIVALLPNGTIHSLTVEENALTAENQDSDNESPKEMIDPPENKQ